MEGCRPKQKYIRVPELLEAFFLCMKSHNRTCPFAQLGPKAAQEDNIPDAALADGAHDGLPLMILFSVIVRRAPIGGEQGIDARRASKGLSKKHWIVRVTTKHFRSSAPEL